MASTLVQHRTGDALARAIGVLRDVLERPLPPGSDAAMDQVRPPAGAYVVYVSTPITTGPAYLDWLITHQDAPAPERERARQEMVRSNIAAVVPLVRAVPEQVPGAHVIDPTALEDVPGWAQADYHRFWAEVILAHVHEVVFADGWTASVGCSVEFAVAMLQGLPSRRADFSVLTQDAGVQDLLAMVPRIQAAHAPAEMHHAVVATLTRDPQ